jgi:replicative DNA helicase
MAGLSDDPDIIEHWQETYDEVMRRAARQQEFGLAGLPTGFPTLDERTGGPQPGQVWIVAARLGQGKTWSLVRMAVAACFSGHSIQYDALEQGRAEIAMRVHTFASSEFGKQVFKNLDLSQGKNFSPREYKEFLQDMRKQVSGKFHIGDTSRGPISPLSIGAQMERNRPQALYLDYLTLMEADEGGADDWRGIGRLSKSLKLMAGRYGIPIIAAAQLNRQAAVGKDLAGPETLAEADAIGRDADAVITMRQMSKRVIAMKLAKFRHGRDGFIWYTRFLPNTGYFEEVTFDEAQDLIAEDKDEEEDDDNVSFKPRQRGSFQAMAAKKRAGHGKGGLVDREKPRSIRIKKTAPAKKKVVVRRRVAS